MRKVMFAGTVLLLAGCASPEYIAQRQVCTDIWLSNIPTDYVDEIREGKKWIDVPYGPTVCETFEVKKGHSKTVCEQKTRVKTIPYTYIARVDRNEAERDRRIAACIQESCLRRFGNPQCKPVE